MQFKHGLILIDNLKQTSINIGKHQALSRKVTCNVSIYFKIGRTSVKPSWTHWGHEQLPLSTHRSNL